MLFHARHAVLTPETEPVKPGFSSAQTPRFTGLKMGGLPGFSGAQVSFPSTNRNTSINTGGPDIRNISVIFPPNIVLLTHYPP